MHPTENQTTDPMDIPCRKHEQRIYKINIDFEESLVEGVVYEGEITDCYIWFNGNGEKTLKLVITYDEFSIFESYHKCPLVNWSPLKAFLVELASELDCTVQPADLIGCCVEFSVKYNTGKDGREFCNLRTIDFILNEDVAPTIPDTTEDEDEEEYFSDFLEDDE